MSEVSAFTIKRIEKGEEFTFLESDVYREMD